MARFNAKEINWEKVEVLGQDGLFTDLRVDRETIPDGWHVYEVRHSDNDWGEPVEICLGVLVNFYGTLLVKEPIKLEPFPQTGNDYFYIEWDKDWWFYGESVRI